MDLIVTLSVDLFLTAFFYLFTPVVVCVTKRKLTHSQIKTLVVINGAIVWFGFAVIRISIGDKPGLSGIVLWSAIAYWLLKKICLKTEDINAYNVEQSNPFQYSLSPAEEQVELKPGQTRLSDMYYDGSADSSKPTAYAAETQEESHSQTSIQTTIIGTSTKSPYCHDSKSDIDVGLIPNKPICTKTITEQKHVLATLHSMNGDRITWVRRGGFYVESINGIVEVFDGYLPSGEEYKTIYLCVDGIGTNTVTIPKGFSYVNV